MRHRIAILLYLLCSPALHAETTSSAPAQVSDFTPPITRISFPLRQWIGKAVFSKDGESIFVPLQNKAINLWEVCTYYWPEALGGLLILTAIICCYAMARIVRSKRISGAPHCRKCHYCLHEFKGERCPECNHLTRHPIKGRPQWIRLFPWSAALIGLAGIYLCLWTLNVPRTGWVNHYLQFWSPELLNWAWKKKIKWLASHKFTIDEIVEYDVKSGLQKRLFLRQPSRMQFDCDVLCLTPDGEGLVVPLFDDDALGIIHTSTARIQYKLDCPEIPRGLACRWRDVSGFDLSGERIYITALDQKNIETNLVEWNWHTGAHAVLYNASAVANDDPPLRRNFQTRRMLVLPDPACLRFIDAPVIPETGRGIWPTLHSFCISPGTLPQSRGSEIGPFGSTVCPLSVPIPAMPLFLECTRAVWVSAWLTLIRATLLNRLACPTSTINSCCLNWMEQERG